MTLECRRCRSLAGQRRLCRDDDVDDLDGGARSGYCEERSGDYRDGQCHPQKPGAGLAEASARFIEDDTHHRIAGTVDEAGEEEDRADQPCGDADDVRVEVHEERGNPGPDDVIGASGHSIAELLNETWLLGVLTSRRGPSDGDEVR